MKDVTQHIDAERFKTFTNEALKNKKEQLTEHIKQYKQDNNTWLAGKAAAQLIALQFEINARIKFLKGL